MTIKVLVIDDSALIRQLLTEILNSDPDIEVVGTAQDPFVARDKIKQLNPDVLTLDVEMPRMDGLTFLRNLMRLRPMPVVMVSTLTQKGADIALEAMDIGAIDYVAKPTIGVESELQAYKDEIIEKVRIASISHVVAYQKKDTEVKPISRQLSYSTTEKIIAIGASTGGTEAIRVVLESMPVDAPGIVICQHIPPVFSTSFAARLDSVCGINVVEAVDGQHIIQGTAYIAPGGKHLCVKRSGAKYYCHVYEGEPVNRHMPSVDVLFDSVFNEVGKNALGVILTGMGNDGAEGLLKMKEAGSYTIVQDEKSSVVWGMPGSAVKLGAVSEQAPLNKIAMRILENL